MKINIIIIQFLKQKDILKDQNGILDLYNKEKEKNDALTEELEDNYINRDKIKAKIEELYKEHDKYKGNLGLQYSKAGLINSQIQVLQELLKEGENK